MLNLSKNQQKILTYYLTNPTQNHYLRELATILEIDAGNLSRTIKTLVSEGFLNEEKKGNLKFFKINPQHHLYPDLKKIIFKTSGVQGALKQVLSKINGIDQAFIFGSFASGKTDEFSDVDLMIIGQVNEDEVVEKITPLESRLGREINYIIFPPQDFKERKNDPFIKKVLKEKKIMLINKNE